MKYFLTISGKADRFEWWVITTISNLLMQVSAIFGFMVLSSEKPPDQLGGCLLILLATVFLWLSIAVTFRRLRDRGRPLWSIVLYLVPFVGWIWMIIECGFLPAAYTGAKRVLVQKTVNAEQTNHLTQ